MTTPEGEGYGVLAGTSMAAPHVSGVAALLLSLSPRLNADEVKSVLQSSARPHPAGTYCATLSGTCGSGLLDANAAVQHVVDNRPIVTGMIQGSAPGVRPLASFTLVGNVKTVGGRVASTAGMSWRQTSGPTVTIPAGSGATVTLTAPSAVGALGFEFAASDSAGYSAAVAVPVIVNAPPTMTPAAAVSGTKGKPLSGSVRGVDPDGDAITYVLVAGPTDFALNASTGAWSWTPNAAGTHGVTIMPTDAYGNGTPVNFVITAAADPNDKEGGGGALTWWLAAVLLIPAVRRRS